MLFCLSVCDETQRAILDQDYHGEVLAVLEARDWKEARQEVIHMKALDDFNHKPGYGWERWQQ